MDDISKKREALIGAYPGTKWRDRVISMKDSQVVATYLRLKREGKI